MIGSKIAKCAIDTVDYNTLITRDAARECKGWGGGDTGCLKNSIGV